MKLRVGGRFLDQNGVSSRQQAFELLQGGPAPAFQLLDLLFREFQFSSREIITEVGNILLNALLGVFGNLLEVHVKFSVPRLRVENVQEVLESITIGSDELNYALLIHTRFQLRASNVTGYLIIILGITSLDRMLIELGRWEERQKK